MHHAAALAELLDQQSPASQVPDPPLLTGRYPWGLLANKARPSNCRSAVTVARISVQTGLSIN